MHSSVEHEQPSTSQALPLVPRMERQRLHDTVVDYLRNLIVEATLVPGMKLNERELCETLGISRTPLREAMKVLAAEGLIDIAPNRGASVSQMSDLDIWEAFETLSGIEAFAAELACQRISEQEIAEIKAAHYAMLACKTHNDLPGYYARNREIHDKINIAARNSVLRQTYLNLNRRVQALRFKSNFDAHKWDSAMQEHSEMLAALEARDGPRLSTIMREHLLRKRDTILKRPPAQFASASEAPTGT